VPDARDGDVAELFLGGLLRESHPKMTPTEPSMPFTTAYVSYSSIRCRRLRPWTCSSASPGTSIHASGRRVIFPRS
jgi:hypothetical protein